MSSLMIQLALLGGMTTPACPFCSDLGGQTLTGDVNAASMVVFGTLTNPRLDPNGDVGTGQTDVVIEAVIKNHEYLTGKKIITLPRYVPVDKGTKKWMIFCDLFKGKLDPYRGIPLESPDMVKYLQGALAVEKADAPSRLRFFFDWLDHKEIEVANDAYKEFAKADYKDFSEMAKTIPADKVARWLQDSNTPAFRFGLYGSMLGHSGKAEYGDLMKKLLEDPQKQTSSGIDGMLAGYVLLRPKEGWQYIRNILSAPEKQFLLRYAGLRAVRFLWETRPDVIAKDEQVAALCLVLNQSDIADLAIEDLRKWKQCQVLDQVLALNNKSTHDVPIIKRAILRFALACQDNPKAAAFVKAARQADPARVQDVEELLKLEQSIK